MKTKTDILSMLPTQLETFIISMAYPKFRSKQIFQWLHQKRVASFDEMHNIPKKMQEDLSACAGITQAMLIEKHVAKRDKTVKLLLNIEDVMVEAVLMRHHHGKSICISTQAGCRMGCTFCASGQSGLIRNLTAGEMLAQVYRTAQGNTAHELPRSIVLMGCGEPLDNFDEVMRFVALINHPDGAHIGQRHITLSTCGLVPQIIKLAEMKTQMTLAISLHAPNDALREKVMPINKAYPIKDVINASKYFIDQTHRRITFEYAMVAGFNDAPGHANELANLLRGMNCHVNLIPINKAQGEYTASDTASQTSFLQILEKHHVQATIRRSLGSEVDAACGQLRAKYINKT